MISKHTNIFFIILILIFSSCSKSPEEKKIFNLFIGTNPDSFESSKYVAVKGNGLKGNVIVTINENPFSFYDGYGQVIQINQWLKKGQNTIGFKGDSSEDIYINIVSTDKSGTSFKVLKRKKIKSGSLNASITFNPKIKYSLPIYNSIVDPNHRSIKKEIENELVQLKGDIINKKAERLYKKLLTGPKIWTEKAYSGDWTQVESFYKKSLKKTYFDLPHNLNSFKKENIKYIIGKNIVFVYSGRKNNDKDHSSPFLFLLSEKTVIPPAKFVKLNNEWIIWQ